jgi:predicted MFS family arabinose efflux permease
MRMLTARGVVVVALGISQTIAWASSFYLPAILASPIARDIDVSPAWIFGAFSGALLVSAALGPTVGRIMDKHDGRAVLISSNILFGIGLTLLAAAKGIVWLLLAWVFLGAGMAAGLYEAAFALLGALYGSEARKSIVGVTLIAGFASTIGWPITSGLEGMIGWRGTCLMWCGAHLVIGLPLNYFVIPAKARSEKEVGKTESEKTKDGAPASESWRGAMALLGFCFATASFVSGAVAAHLPRLLEAFGSNNSVATAAVLVGPAQVAARILELAFLRRAHPLISARLAAAMHPFGAALFLMIGAPAAAALALLHGAGNGLLTIARGTLPLAIFGPVGYGLRSGVLAVPARAGQALAPLLFSVVLDKAGPRWALALSSCLCLAALIALLSIPLPRSDKNDGDEDHP